MAHPPALGSQASRLTRDMPLLGSARIPRLLYGTAWKKDQTADLVYAALRAGFRGVDTAAQPKHYDERAVAAGVGRAVADGLVRRDHLFIQTKFTAPSGQNHMMPYDADALLAVKVRQLLQSSLDNFTLHGKHEPYLDSVILHSPMDNLEDTMTVWETLQSYVPHRVRNLGISNTDLATVQALVRKDAVKPAVVQNRFHARTGFDVTLRAFCRGNGLVYQSFWTLTANAALVQSEPVARVARMAGVDPTVAYYSLVLGLGNVTTLVGTTSEAHMRKDLEGIETVGLWADGDDAANWDAALESFRSVVGDA